MTLADGDKRTSNLRVFPAEVKMGNWTIIVDMNDLPGAADNPTLMGIDTLEDLGIVINAPQRAWHYVNKLDRYALV